MKRILLTVATFCMLSNVLLATNVRGKIKCVETASGTEVARENVKVELFVKEEKEWKQLSETSTAKDGMYYFSNLDKNKKYTLKIDESYYPISILPKETQDLPPIMLCPK